MGEEVEGLGVNQGFGNIVHVHLRLGTDYELTGVGEKNLIYITATDVSSETLVDGTDYIPATTFCNIRARNKSAFLYCSPGLETVMS